MTVGRAFLIGTRHDFHGLGPGWKRECVDQFLAFIQSHVNSHEIELVGEESSPEAVKYFARDEFGGLSAVEQWCYGNSVAYLALDPTDDECIALGLPASQDAKAALEEGGVAMADKLAAIRFEGRECEWVRRLDSHSTKAVLLIVGASHIETFAEKLAGRGWKVVITESNWIPSA